MEYKANSPLASHAVDRVEKKASVGRSHQADHRSRSSVFLFDAPVIDGKPALREEHRCEPIRFATVLLSMRTLFISNVIRTHQSHPADWAQWSNHGRWR